MVSSAAMRDIARVEAIEKGGDLASRRADGTLTDVMEIVVREAILAGAYRPGQKLPITAMARENKVSLSVMREALTRLAVDGIVTSEAMLGFSVMRTSVADLDEIADLLKLLIATATRNAVMNATPEWEASLIAAHHLFKRTVTGEIADVSRSIEVDRAHTHFVHTLTSGCGSARLMGLLTSLMRAMRLYHRLAIGLLRHEADERIATYCAVTECAIAGDATSAVRLMIDDIDTATAICRAYLADGPAHKRH